MAATTESRLASVPLGTGATGMRVESDSLGEVEVPAEHYWGAQTQRSLIHFSIGDDHMPKPVYHAYGYVKKAAALVNHAAGRLDAERVEAIASLVETGRPGAGLLPDVENLRAASATVAVAVANQAATDGVADPLGDPVQAVQDAMWKAAYRPVEVK